MLKKKSKVTWLEITPCNSIYDNNDHKILFNVNQIISIEERSLLDDAEKAYVKGSIIKTAERWCHTEEPYSSICDRLMGKK